MASGSRKLNDGSPPKPSTRPPCGLRRLPVLEAVIPRGSKSKGICSPPSPVTKNRVLVVFHALVSEDEGEPHERPTVSGRVFASVTRSIRDRKVGSVNRYPAPPSDGGGGSERASRSTMAS